MAASAQLQLRAAMAALLLADTPLAGGRVHENRELQLATGVDSQVHVNFRGSRPTDMVIYTGHPREWMTEIELVFLARKSGGEEASDVADALWAEAYGRVMADQSLGGLAMDLLPGEVIVDDAEADTSLCRLTWTVTVQHRTSNNSLT